MNIQPPTTTIGAMIRKSRKVRSMTQRDLAVAAGVHLSDVSGAERGERIPTKHFVLCVVQVFGFAKSTKDRWIRMANHERRMRKKQLEDCRRAPIYSDDPGLPDIGCSSIEIGD